MALRQSRLDEAATLLEKSFRVPGDVEHVYTAACNALSHCFVGDLQLRRQRYDEALSAFRRAQKQVAESPRSLGIDWPQLRSLVGLAQSRPRGPLYPEPQPQRGDSSGSIPSIPLPMNSCERFEFAG